MPRFALILTVAILCTACVFAQQSLPDAAKATCGFSELFRKDGWTVPGLAGAKTKTPRAAVRNIPGVFVTMLEPADADSNMTLEDCSRDHPGRIEIVENAPIKVLALWAFDAGGKIFAYRLQYACETVDGGVRHELACATSIFFYDMDGSGKFTVMRYPKWKSAPAFTTYLPEVIPDWAKQSKGAPSK